MAEQTSSAAGAAERHCAPKGVSGPAAGALRQGILVGPEGILVRLAPNRCYPIPADRFVWAEEWSGGGVEGGDYLRIVTRDGPVDIWDHDITADAAEVNRAVAMARAGSTGCRG